MPGPDTIVLPAGTYPLTILGIEQEGAEGDLNIRDDVTVAGAGAASTIVDGNGNDRVLPQSAATS